jgi:hypothetical protein
MSHNHHQSLSGYSSAQILVDGCGECEHRSEHRDHGLGNLNPGNFARAWYRAARWGTAGVPDVSYAEVPLLSVLRAVQVQLERRDIPIGHIPSGTLIVPAAGFYCSCNTAGCRGECEPERNAQADPTASHEV